MAKKKDLAPRRRNPVARAAQGMHRGGAHGKTTKAQRRMEKVAIGRSRGEEDNRYIVEYALDYEHIVRVGIAAKSEKEAIEIAERKFDEGSIWDSTPDCPLLYDDFEETDDNTLEFKVVDTRKSRDPWPNPGVCVTVQQQELAARKAAQLLVEAYRRGEESGGTIEWEDLDQAYEAALEAVGGRAHQGMTVTTEPDRDRTVEDMLEAQRMGFEVHPDADQPGKFTFSDPNGDGSDISFETESAAWKQILAELPTYRDGFADDGSGPKGS